MAGNRRPVREGKSSMIDGRCTYRSYRTHRTYTMPSNVSALQQINNYLHPITYYLLPITYYLLPITYYPLPIHHLTPDAPD